jgi:hypothetical protein
VTASKPAYIPGETIVINFSNASGNAHDWIGLYVAGAPNSAYLQWFYTDGTKTGTAGIINGSVNFPGGLSSPGNYEARLFFNNSSTLQASTPFTVQGLPGQATNPNPPSGQPGVALNPALSWTAGPGATSHQVYFGTNPSPGAAEFKGSQTATTYTPGTLSASTTYYWRIDEVNGQGTTTGVPWSFTTGAGPPTVTTSKPAYNPGETIVVNFSNASGSAHDWIGLYNSGAANTAILAWFYTDGTQTGTAGIINGSVNFPGGLSSPGNYEVRLFFNNSYTVQATVAFAVQASGPPSVTTSKPAYNTGETIVVSFSNASGSAHDWIGLYNAGAVNTAYVAWLYTDGTQTGTAGIINGTVNFTGGLPNAGSYEARLFFNNTFTMQASTTFSVQSGPPGQANYPNPVTGQTGVGLNPTLTWTAGAGAASHQVYFGTSPSLGAGDLKSTQAGTSYAPANLAAQTTYDWRIDEVNGQGTTTGVVWNFTTAASSSIPTVAPSKGAYRPSSPIVANFGNASGNAHDWIGLYNAGAANTTSLAWLYTDGTQTGTAGIINGGVTFANGLASPGNYEVRLFFNDGFTLQASAAFVISSTATQSPASPPATSPSSTTTSAVNPAVKLASTPAKSATHGIGLTILKADGSVALECSASVGQRYRIEASSDLVHWTPITIVDATTESTVMTDRSAPKFSQRFYRAIPLGSPQTND